MLDGADMPEFDGVAVPEDFWWALPPPIPLAGMPYPPVDFHWTQAATHGFRTVVCLADDTPGYDPSPLRCKAVRLVNLSGGKLPDDPKDELIKVRRVVDAVTTSLARSEGVLVHCGGGRGRSGTVVGAALVALGKDPGDVAAWLDEVHRDRGRLGWPESPWQCTVLGRFAEWR